MYDRDNDFVTMLLTMSLSPNREEYAHPLSTQEMRRLEEKVRRSPLPRIGSLLNMDIGGLMLNLELEEEEAYRIFTLLNRSVQMNYIIEKFLDKGIDVVSCYRDIYPSQLKSRMKETAPPVLYMAGNTKLIDRAQIAILGMSGVKTSEKVRESVDMLVRWAVEHDYVILTGAEPGVSRVTLGAAMKYGGSIAAILGGSMQEKLLEEPFGELIAKGRAAVLSVEHPESLLTATHAATRNKLLIAMSEASFIYNTDGKRGEPEAIRNHYCDWIYADSGYPENRSLINRGAVPFGDITTEDLDAMSRHWNSGDSRQLSMFDLL